MALTLLSAMSMASVELVTNGNFETPTPDGSWNNSNPDGAYLPSSFNGWTVTGAAGVWRPNAGMFNAMPSPVQAGYAGDGGSAGMLYQDLNHVVGAGEAFTAKFYIGDRANLVSKYGISTEGTAALYADNNLVCAFTLFSNLDTGDFSGIFFGLNSVYMNQFVGKNLNLRLTSPSGKQASFDDISVTLDSVPEPATMTVVGLGVLALIRRKRA